MLCIFPKINCCLLSIKAVFHFTESIVEQHRNLDSLVRTADGIIPVWCLVLRTYTVQHG